jgi:hypothetical protein
MYDPCAHCNCILHRKICKKFCTAYKIAVERDVHNGMIAISIAQHDRIRRQSHK